MAQPAVTFPNESYPIDELQAAWLGTLEPVYPTKEDSTVVTTPHLSLAASFSAPHPRGAATKHAKPKVLIPAFPGTNSEYDSAKAFNEAGALSEIQVFRNLTPAHIEESLEAFAAKIRQSQILMFPGGFSAGDEPDGSAKFIATVIRNPRVADAIMDLIKNRDGLILGVCNGFQALIKTGLVPYGEIRDPHAEAPTLTFNDIGRHVSCYVTTRIASTMSPWTAGM